MFLINSNICVTGMQCPYCHKHFRSNRGYKQHFSHSAFCEERRDGGSGKNFDAMRRELEELASKPENRESYATKHNLDDTDATTATTMLKKKFRFMEQFGDDIAAQKQLAELFHYRHSEKEKQTKLPAQEVQRASWHSTAATTGVQTATTGDELDGSDGEGGFVMRMIGKN